MKSLLSKKEKLVKNRKFIAKLLGTKLNLKAKKWGPSAFKFSWTLPFLLRRFWYENWEL